MRLFTDLLGWIVFVQLMLAALFTFADEEATALYAILDYSPLYGGYLLLSVLLAAYICLQLMRRGLLRGVGQKSRRTATTRGYRS